MNNLIVPGALILLALLRKKVSAAPAPEESVVPENFPGGMSATPPASNQIMPITPAPAAQPINMPPTGGPAPISQPAPITEPAPAPAPAPTITPVSTGGGSYATMPRPANSNLRAF